MASQITSPAIVYSTVYSGADQRKYRSSASLAFVRGIHRWPVNSPHKGPVTRKIFHLMTSSCIIIYLFALYVFCTHSHILALLAKVHFPIPSYHSSPLLAHCEGNHQWSMDSHHKGPIMHEIISNPYCHYIITPSTFNERLHHTNTA